MNNEKTLILIDGHALAFRQYFALERTNMKTTDGTPSWGVYGFFKSVFYLLKNNKLKPDAIAVAFDVRHKTFRVDKYPEIQPPLHAGSYENSNGFDLRGFESF